MICYKLLLKSYFNLPLHVYFNCLQMFPLYQVLISRQFENHRKQRANYVFPITRCFDTLCISKFIIFNFYNDVSCLSNNDLMLCLVRLQLQCCSTQRVTNCPVPRVFGYLSPPFVSIHTPLDCLNSKLLFCRHCVLLSSLRAYGLFPSTYISSLCLEINRNLSIIDSILIKRNV